MFGDKLKCRNCNFPNKVQVKIEKILMTCHHCFKPFELEPQNFNPTVKYKCQNLECKRTDKYEV